MADVQSTGLGQRGGRRKSLLDGAVDLKIWQHITTVSLIICFTWKPKKANKWVLIGPKPIAVVFTSLLFQFVYQAGLAS